MIKLNPVPMAWIVMSYNKGTSWPVAPHGSLHMDHDSAQRVAIELATDHPGTVITVFELKEAWRTAPGEPISVPLQPEASP